MRFATRSLALAVAALALGMANGAAAQDTTSARRDTAATPRDSVATAPDAGARPAAAGIQDTLPPPRGTVAGPGVPTGTLRTGDILALKVYRDSELSGSYLIEANGYVQIPGLGTIRAAGLRPDQVTQSMIEAMRSKGFREPELAVRPMIRISVLGQVRLPMLYSIDPGLSLLQLITMAGGPTDRADLKRTRVIRDGKAYVVDIEAALHGSASGRVALYSNDVVFIPPKRGLTQQNVQFIVGITAAGLALVTTILLLTGYR
jgi:protein involved in polysaccharide export with SLBB domain